MGQNFYTVAAEVVCVLVFVIGGILALIESVFLVDDIHSDGGGAGSDEPKER